MLLQIGQHLEKPVRNMKPVREAHIPAGLKAAGPNPKSAIRMMNQVAPGINGTIVLLEGAKRHEIIGIDVSSDKSSQDSEPKVAEEKE